jgi:hypothetical protein
MVAESKAAPAISFKDVPANAPNAKAIILATKLGIIKGYEDGSFRAKATITRAEFASMLVRALGLTSAGDSDFIDTKGHWAEAEIGTLSDMGIVKGTPEGLFKPNANATRSESLLMILRILNASLEQSLDVE